MQLVFSRFQICLLLKIHHALQCFTQLKGTLIVEGAFVRLAREAVAFTYSSFLPFCKLPAFPMYSSIIFKSARPVLLLLGCYV